MPRRSGFERVAGAVLLTVLWACASTSRPARADEESGEARHRVRFQVESAREVANDWLTAVVGVSAEDVDPAELANRVNRTMAWALEQARAAEGVELQSGGYSTQPVYEDGKLRRWRAGQDLVLESGDERALIALVGTLQSRLQLRSLRFSVSEETRGRVEEELVAEALGAFRARADLVRRNLQAGGYAIDDISVDAGGQGPPVMQARFEARAMEMAPPAVESGSSRVTVSVQGTIVLE